MIKAQKEDPEDSICYKWSPAEWKFDGIENRRLDQLSDQLSSFSIDIEGNGFEQHVSKLFTVCMRVLSTVKREELFNEFSENFILLFDVSDYENETNQLDWVRQLNSEKDTREFEKWLKSDDN